MATQASICAWEIPQTEEPGGQGVGGPWGCKSQTRPSEEPTATAITAVDTDCHLSCPCYSTGKGLETLVAMGDC